MNIQFEGQIQLVAGYRIVRLPNKASIQLPSRGMVMAQVHAGSQSVIAPLEPDGKGGHWLQLTKEIEGKPGDTVSYAVILIKDWPKPNLPQDMLEGITAAGLLDVWDDLTVKAQWEWLRWMRATNNPATRKKRILVACSKLQAGERRPCCFNSASCTVMEVSKSGVLMDA